VSYGRSMGENLHHATINLEYSYEAPAERFSSNLPILRRGQNGARRQETPWFMTELISARAAATCSVAGRRTI
jgi:hypothetical protein